MEITYWNGTPMARAIEVTGDRLGGSNMEARRARAVQMMTFRPLSITLPPEEDWAVIHYLDGDQERETRFDWKVWDQRSIQEAATSGTLGSSEIDPYSPEDPAAHLLGVDAAANAIKQVHSALSKALDGAAA